MTKKQNATAYEKDKKAFRRLKRNVAKSIGIHIKAVNTNQYGVILDPNRGQEIVKRIKLFKPHFKIKINNESYIKILETCDSMYSIPAEIVPFINKDNIKNDIEKSTHGIYTYQITFRKGNNKNIRIIDILSNPVRNIQQKKDIITAIQKEVKQAIDRAERCYNDKLYKDFWDNYNLLRSTRDFNNRYLNNYSFFTSQISVSNFENMFAIKITPRIKKSITIRKVSGKNPRLRIESSIRLEFQGIKIKWLESAISNKGVKYHTSTNGLILSKIERKIMRLICNEVKNNSQLLNSLHNKFAVLVTEEKPAKITFVAGKGVPNQYTLLDRRYRMHKSENFLWEDLQTLLKYMTNLVTYYSISISKIIESYKIISPNSSTESVLTEVLNNLAPVGYNIHNISNDNITL